MMDLPRRMYWDPHKERAPDFLAPLCKNVSSLAVHSNDVTQGGLFAVIKGVRHDGLAYVGDALSRGAKVLLMNHPAVLDDVPEDIFVVESPEPRLALALLCGSYYTPQPESCLMVTGTDGKSSTSEFCRQMLDACGVCAASLGTLGLIYRQQPSGALIRVVQSLTTPGAIDVGLTLQELAGHGVETVVMEASSHGLSQWRVDGITPHAAALTHIAHDHLDFHGTWMEYRQSKMRLFSLLPEEGWAVLPMHDANGRSIGKLCLSEGRNVFGFSTNAQSDPCVQIFCQHIEEGAASTRFSFHDGKPDSRPFTVDLPLWGDFQAINLMAAYGLGLSVVGDAERMQKAMNACRAVKGRMQLIANNDNGGRIFVDYAHTPGALQHVLRTLRARSRGSLWVVFGCGGNRDRHKRAVMGQIATAESHHVVITDDNPREEDPAIIRMEIRQGAPVAHEIGSREKAISWAISHMKSQDTLVVAGKGHEDGQIIGTQTVPFDDSNVVELYARRAGWHPLSFPSWALEG